MIRVDFHDPQGGFVTGFIPQDNGAVIDSYDSKTWRASPATLYPLGVYEYDSSTGRPFFKVEWVAAKEVIKPMIAASAVLGAPNFPTEIDYKAITNLAVKVVDQKCDN